MQAQLSLRLWGLPECLNLSGLDLGGTCSPGPASDCSRRNNREPEQWGQGGYTRREWGQTQCGWGTASAHQCYLFAASLPPHSATEKVSLKKKKKSFPHRPLCVRAEARHWRDQQTEEVITEGNALEATGNRLKPRGYYGLHRKGPIDLQKYKSDQGTSQKWTEPTILTTKPENVLDIFLLFLQSFFLFFKIFKKNFKSSIIPLIFTFITYYFAKKKDPIFF